MIIGDLGDHLKRFEREGIPKVKPITSHELAKQLLLLPDQEITIAKGEGEGYVSEWIVHPGGPWLDHGGRVRMQIERLENGVSAK